MAEFWLPPDFLSDDDDEPQKKEPKNAENESVYGLDLDFSSGSDSLNSFSGLSSGDESVASSESEEEDYVAGLTQKMAKSTLLENLWKTETLKSDKIPFSPQPTECGCKQQASSRGSSPNCPTRRDAEWEFLIAAAREIKRKKMAEELSVYYPDAGSLSYEQLHILNYEQMKREHLMEQQQAMAMAAKAQAKTWPYQPPPPQPQTCHVAQPVGINRQAANLSTSSLSPHQQKSLSSHQQPSILLHQQKSILSHQQQSILLHRQQSILPHQQQSVLSNQQPSILLRQQPSVLPHQQKSVLPHQQKSVLPHQQKSVLPHQQQSLLTHQQQSVSLRQQQAILPHQQKSLLPRQQKSLVPHQQKSLLLHQQQVACSSAAVGGSGMRAVFLGNTRPKREPVGTGVFLPRGAGGVAEPRKNSGCSTVLLPDRVVQALNLNLEAVDAHSRVNNVFTSDIGVNMWNNVPMAPKQKPNLHPTAEIALDDFQLPLEWTY